MMTPPLRSFSKAQIARALKAANDLKWSTYGYWKPVRGTILNADGFRAVEDTNWHAVNWSRELNELPPRVLPLKKKNAG